MDQWLHMKGGLKPHSFGLKPFLSEQNIYSWLIYALEMITPNDTTKFQDMNDLIHVDEKQFYLTRGRQQFILAENELSPHCCVHHKGHSTKVMFVFAVVCPQYNNATKFMVAWKTWYLDTWILGACKMMISQS